MIVPRVITQKHALIKPYVERVGDRVRDLVRAYCDEHGYAFTGRTKEAGSLAEKIESGRYKKWSDLDDTYACAIVIPTLREEPEAVAFLERVFDKVEVRGRGVALKDPEVFRFDATRFIGRLRKETLSTDAELLVGVMFEVQIRTAFEHAWSVTTHALVYKGDRVDWRRLRLAAQLKAAVEQMDSLILGFDFVADGMAVQKWPELEVKMKIEQLFRHYIEIGTIPQEAAPDSWKRFCDNLFVLILATTKSRVRELDVFAAKFLDTIRIALDKASSQTFPRSLSLLQFALGSLIDAGAIDGPLNRYTPLLTDEFRDLYPDSSSLGAGFDCEIP